MGDVDHVGTPSHRRLTALVGVVAVIALAACSAKTATIGTTTSVVTTATTAITAPPATTPATTVPKGPTTTAAPAQQHDKHFALIGVQVKQDFAGDFGGSAQVKNTGSQSYTAIIKLTFKQGGQVVGSADGSADAVSAGQTVTVDLLSTDKYNGQPVTYDFQVSTEY